MPHINRCYVSFQYLYWCLCHLLECQLHWWHSFITFYAKWGYGCVIYRIWFRFEKWSVRLGNLPKMVLTHNVQFLQRTYLTNLILHHWRSALENYACPSWYFWTIPLYGILYHYITLISTCSMTLALTEGGSHICLSFFDYTL